MRMIMVMPPQTIRMGSDGRRERFAAADASEVCAGPEGRHDYCDALLRAQGPPRRCMGLCGCHTEPWPFPSADDADA